MSTKAEAKVEKSVVGTGKVAAVCYSPQLINGVGKQAHEAARITRWGIPGDRHYGETRVSRGHTVPNDRPITVVGADGARAACKRLGIPDLPPGGLGENILCEGLGDLSEMQSGDQIHLRSESGETRGVLNVRKQNDPCAGLMVYHKQMPKEMMGKRGVLCTVLEEGEVAVGDTVVWLR